MANPFSAVATPFRVAVDDKTYWANCAWDCFGIVAALHASEAAIHATCAQSGTELRLDVAQGKPSRGGEVVHFQVPFRRWYDDLVFT